MGIDDVVRSCFAGVAEEGRKRVREEEKDEHYTRDGVSPIINQSLLEVNGR